VAQFLLKSTSFENGGRIPRQFTCDGKDLSPALFWTGVPERAVTLALIVDDPDAPRGNWVHWVLFDMPASRRDLPEQVPPKDTIAGGGVHGLNDFGRLGWGGPCPPSGMHQYVFTLHAVGTTLKLPARASREDVTRAMQGHIVGTARLIGKYARGRETSA
jgi:Raf kinase inhibitor-like YbhB/YbcL family protein